MTGCSGAPPPDLQVQRIAEEADRVLAERLVVNLVENAIRHNVSDGWVSVSCEAGVLTVTNTGPVVPTADAVPRPDGGMAITVRFRP